MVCVYREKEKAALAQAADEKQTSQGNDITPAAVAQAVAALAAAQEAVERLLMIPPLSIHIEPLREERGFTVLIHPDDLPRLPGKLTIEECDLPSMGLSYLAWKNVNGIVFRAWCGTREEAESCA